MRDQNRR